MSTLSSAVERQVAAECSLPLWQGLKFVKFAINLASEGGNTMIGAREAHSNIFFLAVRNWLPL